MYSGPTKREVQVLQESPINSQRTGEGYESVGVRILIYGPFEQKVDFVFIRIKCAQIARTSVRFIRARSRSTRPDGIKKRASRNQSADCTGASNTTSTTSSTLRPKSVAARPIFTEISRKPAVLKRQSCSPTATSQ